MQTRIPIVARIEEAEGLSTNPYAAKKNLRDTMKEAKREGQEAKRVWKNLNKKSDVI